MDSLEKRKARSAVAQNDGMRREAGSTEFLDLGGNGLGVAALLNGGACRASRVTDQPGTGRNQREEGAGVPVHQPGRTEPRSCALTLGL